MRNKNIWLPSISILILIVDIVMAFILNAYSVEITATDSKILYICVKCLVVALLIATVVLGFRKKDIANYILQYACVLFLQFIPLAIRYLSIVKNGFLISIILTFILLIVYVAIVVGLSILSKKSVIAAKKLEGKTISIKEETENEQNE